MTSSQMLFLEVLCRNSSLIFHAFFDIEGYSMFKLISELLGEITIYGKTLKNIPKYRETRELQENDHQCVVNQLFSDISLFLSREKVNGTYVKIPNPSTILRHYQHYLLRRTLPVEIGNFTNLTTLNLSMSGLSGEIPLTIGKLKSLTFLHLANNMLVGSIPSTFVNLHELQVLDLSNNKLQGEIPQDIGNLMKLRLLYLNGNMLSGNIPQSIIKMKHLQRLCLNDNNFTGVFLEDIHSLCNLQLLNLASNSTLTGDLEEILFPAALKWLFIKYTSFQNKFKFRINILQTSPNLLLDF